MCTGPIAINGAKTGEVLQVHIKEIKLHYDWGYTYSRPLLGALPAPAMQPANEPTVMIAASKILDRMDRRIERQRGVQRFYRER